MTMHVISDFTRPQGFGERFWAMVESFINKLDRRMTLPPEALPQ